MDKQGALPRNRKISENGANRGAKNLSSLVGKVSYNAWM